jgi:hypothetical protein
MKCLLFGPGGVNLQIHLTPAQDGNSFLGMLTFSGDPIVDFREIVGAALLEPLEVGSTYYFQMHVVPSIGGYYGMQWISNNIGMQLTMQAYEATENPIPLNNFAHVFENEIIQDTAGWSLLSGSFVADEPYTHIAIGNFFNDAFTDTIHFSGSQSLGAYYFVDNLCLSKNPLCNTQTAIDDFDRELHIYPNPAQLYLRIQSPFPVHRILIRDMNGKIAKDVSEFCNPISQELDLKEITSGTFLIEIFTEGSVYFEKLVVFKN